VLAQLVVGYARHDRQRPTGQLVLGSPSNVRARILAGQIDDPSTVLGITLCCRRNGQILNRIALSVIDHRPQGVAAVQTLIKYQPALSLLHRLARVVQLGVGGNAFRVVLECVAWQTQWIIRFDAYSIGDEREPGIVIELQAQLGVTQISTRPAMVAITLGSKAIKTHDVIQLRASYIIQAAGLRAVAPTIVAAGREAAAHGGRQCAILREHLDHAAGRITIKRGERSPQHFDMLDARDVDVGCLPLTIRHGSRNTVYVQTHASHSKRGARTKTSY